MHFLLGAEISECLLFATVVAAKGQADATVIIVFMAFIATFWQGNSRCAQSTSGLLGEPKYILLRILCTSIKSD